MGALSARWGRWERRHRGGLWALLAVGAVGVAGQLWRETAQPVEQVWAGLGAYGLVYALRVWYSRVQLERWRQRHGIDGLLALTTRGHVRLRLVNVLLQVLILISGLAAMLTPEPVRADLRLQDLIVTTCLIGIGALCTLGAWLAERIAEQQIRAARERQLQGTPLERLEPPSPLGPD